MLCAIPDDATYSSSGDAIGDDANSGRPLNKKYRWDIDAE